MNLEEELSKFDRISFIESSHTYLIDNEHTGAPSVTRLLKLFKKEFDKDGAAQRVAKRRRITVDQVLAEWSMNNLYSTTLGSTLHKYIENFYTQKNDDFTGDFDKLGFDEKQKFKKNLPVLVEFFQNFQKDHKHYKCLKNEFAVGDIEDTKVCGMFDMLVQDKETSEIELWDFKTNKRMSHSPYGMLFEPFSDMSEGELNEYTIQLNMYKHFIEKYTNIKINKMKVIWFFSENSNYQIFEMPSIQEKITLMLEKYKAKTLFEAAAL